jgi:hypothetical protein
MAARYRVPVADPLLAEKDFWLEAEGFRLVSVDGPWLAHPNVTICTFEDDDAPPELEGKLVEPTLSRAFGVSYATGEPLGDGKVRVIGRQVVA